MAKSFNPVVSAFVGWATRLRFPWLFGIAAALFAVDLVVPDFVPLADEVLLGLLTAMLASWRKRKLPEGETDDREQDRDATPTGPE